MVTYSSLQQLFSDRRSDPAITLLARTISALRTDSQFVQADGDVVGGGFLAGEAAASLAPEALDRTLARIEAISALDERAAKAVKQGDSVTAEVAALPSPLRETALAALDADHWRFGGVGIRRLIIGSSGEAEVELMRIEPGYGVPTHDHTAEELTLIVTGAYEDGHAYYGPGDLSVAEPGFAHAPTAQKGDICYVLAVTYGSPRFLGLFGQFQKVLGFPWSPVVKRELG